MYGTHEYDEIEMMLANDLDIKVDSLVIQSLDEEIEDVVDGTVSYEHVLGCAYLMLKRQGSSSKEQVMDFEKTKTCNDQLKILFIGELPNPAGVKGCVVGVVYTTGTDANFTALHLGTTTQDPITAIYNPTFIRDISTKENLLNTWKESVIDTIAQFLKNYMGV